MKTNWSTTVGDEFMSTLYSRLPMRAVPAGMMTFDDANGYIRSMMSGVVTRYDLGADEDLGADADIVEARFVDIVPGERIVQAVDFVSDDPANAGTMTMTWEITAVEAGTRVGITAEDVPDGISAEDHAAGLASSLAKLAAYLEQ